MSVGQFPIAGARLMVLFCVCSLCVVGSDKTIIIIKYIVNCLFGVAVFFPLCLCIGWDRFRYIILRTINNNRSLAIHNSALHICLPHVCLYICILMLILVVLLV